MNRKREEPKWYCIELRSEDGRWHGFSAALTTRERADDMLTNADLMAPPGMEIHYWYEDDPPFARPTPEDARNAGWHRED